MNNEEQKAEITAQQSDAADVTTSSQTIAKPNVGGSFCQVRFTKVQDSLWYSLSDVVNFLVEKKAISANRNIDFFIRKSIAKSNIKSNAHYNFNQLLSITPFDVFMNWVKFDSIYTFCLKNEVNKIKETRILEAIDLNNLYEIDRLFPQIFKILKEVEFVER